MPAVELDLKRAREVGIEAARSAGGLLRRRVNSIREVHHKSAVDIVTDVDFESEQEVCATLQAAFPTHSILGEEGGIRVGSDARFRWIVDPLDGTTNYAHGFPFFCVSIGLEVEGKLTLGVAYAPSLDELYVAEAGRGAMVNDRPIQVSATRDLPQALLATGFPYDRAEFPRALKSFEVMSLHSQAVRRAGSAVLDLCYVACGRLDGYWEHLVQPWDIAAGALIVVEAGGSVTATDGSAFRLEDGQVLASNGLLHASLANTLNGL
ncbi:MAG: inositol monophosphatase [Chloroflexi bacterium]|nr:inositol monophosphatase [Chloroflexota bacterium]